MYYSEPSYAGKAPNVNRVCFCFPLFFFPFPAPGASAESPPLWAEEGVEEPDPHAGVAGPWLPMMFFKDTLPLTWGFCLPLLLLGRPGKALSDSLGGGARLALLLTFCELGRGTTVVDGGRLPEVPPFVDHGVLR